MLVNFLISTSCIHYSRVLRGIRRARRKPTYDLQPAVVPRSLGVDQGFGDRLSPDKVALTRVERADALFGGRDAAVELGEGVRPRVRVAEIDAERGEQVLRRA